MIIYILALPALLWMFLRGASLIPLALYGVALLAQAAVLAVDGGIVRSLCAIPLMLLTHLGYGVGFARGLFTRLQSSSDRPKTDVVLETVLL